MIDISRESDLLGSLEFTNSPFSEIRDERSAQQKCERFIAFYFGKGLYCIHADVVAEVIHPLPIAALPNSPGGVLGLAALRGEVIAVLNLRDLLAEEGALSNGKSKIIVLRPTEDRTQFAIPADRMHEIVMLPSSFLHSNSQNTLVRPVEHEFVVYNLIDTGKISDVIAHNI